MFVIAKDVKSFHGGRAKSVHYEPARLFDKELMFFRRLTPRVVPTHPRGENPRECVSAHCGDLAPSRKYAEMR